MTINTLSFTSLDLANLEKYSIFHTNETLKISLENLQYSNIAENHMKLFHQLIGYLRCMKDMDIIENKLYDELEDEIFFLMEELKRMVKED